MNFTVLDVILLLIPIIALFIGAKKGLFSISTKIVKIILSIFLTILFAPDIIGSFTAPYFTELIRCSIVEYLTVNCPDITAAQSVDALPSILKLAVRIFNIDLTSAGESAGSAVISDVSAMISAPLGNFVAAVITYIVLFFAFLIIISIVLSLLNALFKKGPLMMVDRILGALFMAIVALLISCLVATVTGMIAPDFVGGRIYEFFRDLDPLSLIFSV